MLQSCLLCCGKSLRSRLQLKYGYAVEHSGNIRSYLQALTKELLRGLDCWEQRLEAVFLGESRETALLPAVPFHQSSFPGILPSTLPGTFEGFLDKTLPDLCAYHCNQGLAQIFWGSFSALNTGKQAENHQRGPLFSARKSG